MDVNTLMKLMMSQNSTQALSQNTQTSQQDVSNVLAAVLPQLLNGASQQATNQATAASFLGALQQHGQADTRDLGAFLGNVDAADGAKIIQHLLGAQTQQTTQTVAQQTGVSQKQVSSIMSNAAPLLMSVLGQQNAKQQNKAQTGGSELIEALMKGAINAAISGAVSGAKQSTKKSGISAGDVIGLVGKLLK